MKDTGLLEVIIGFGIGAAEGHLLRTKQVDQKLFGPLELEVFCCLQWNVLKFFLSMFEKIYSKHGTPYTL